MVICWYMKSPLVLGGVEEEGGGYQVMCWSLSSAFCKSKSAVRTSPNFYSTFEATYWMWSELCTLPCWCTWNPLRNLFKIHCQTSWFDLIYSGFVKSSLMQPFAFSVDKEKQQWGENSRVDGGDAVEQPRQATSHGETMNDPPGGLTEHQSNEALLALHSSPLSPFANHCFNIH